jgi:ADP-ribosylglycohydrolase
MYGHDAPITDDTQMTLFTAEGLLEAAENGTDPVAEVWAAYRRWVHTQGGSLPEGTDPNHGLLAIDDLHSRRAPGNTCLGAASDGIPGSPDEPINNSKGCGGIMRVAPVGLVAATDDDAYTTGCEVAALTHGHSCGWMSAGVQAVVVRRLLEGDSPPDAVAAGRSFAVDDPRDRGVVEAIDHAVELAADAPLDGWRLEELGGAWVGEEALSISLACLLAEDDPNEALLLAVNHSGDSDSTGAIVGNLVGAYRGVAAIKDEWRSSVELHETIKAVGDQLATVSLLRGRAEKISGVEAPE